MLYSVIIAGGTGTRLWPLSRQARPKQMQSFGMPSSLLQQAAERLVPLIPPERTLVVTARPYVPLVAEQLPMLPRENILGEPEGRNTAPALGWAAEHLLAGDAEAAMVVLTADHVIRPRETMQAAVRRAVELLAAEPGTLVTFGVRPTRAHTGYGYLHLGEPLGPGTEPRPASNAPLAYRLLGFREKPDRATAESYLTGGCHLWNSGMFAWRADTLRAALAAHAGELAEKLRAWRAGGMSDGLWSALPKISIDYAVMEPVGRAGQVRCVALDLEWHDLGGYEALEAILPRDGSGNSIAAGPSVVLGQRNVVLSETPADGHLLAVVGLDDVVVVRTPTATLVCRRSDAERVREVVEELRRRGAREYL